MTNRKRIPKSIKFKEHFSTIHRLINRAQSMLYCGEVDKLGISWTEEERKKLHEAEQMVASAEIIVGDIFAERIGKQAIKEAKWGDGA